MNDDGKKIFNVNSNSQQGGITAGQVNINMDRTIDSEDIKTDLIDVLCSADCHVTVGALGMGGEPDQLANQLLDIAKEAGCETAGVLHGVGFEPFKGIQIQVPQINPPIGKATELKNILNKAGIQSEVVYGLSLKEGSIYLYVGYKP